MSYMNDPEKKAAAIAKQQATRAVLGPRPRATKIGPLPFTAPSSSGRTRSTSANGGQHPTRDSGA